MAIKITADGHKTIVDVIGKIDKNYFPNSWHTVKLNIDKTTSLLFNRYAKTFRCGLNKEATEKAGCNIYGVAYIVHPDMVSAKIKEVSVKEMIENDRPQEAKEFKPKEASVKADSVKEDLVKADSKTNIIAGCEAIRLIKSIHNCSAEALDILSQYCKFSMIQLDVNAYIEAEKKERS